MLPGKPANPVYGLPQRGQSGTVRNPHPHRENVVECAPGRYLTASRKYFGCGGP